MHLVLLVSLLSLSLSLYGSPLHKSNVLGQDLGGLGEGETSVWTLQDGVLSQNGNVVRIITDTGNVITSTNVSDKTVSTKTYEDGRLVEENDQFLTTTYAYDSWGRLAKLSAKDAAGVESLTFFLYNRADGKLAGVLETSRNSTFYPQEGIFTSTDGKTFERFERIGGTFILRTYLIGSEVQDSMQNVDIDEEGNLVYVRKSGDETTNETYDAQNNLIHKVITLGTEKIADDSFVYKPDGVLEKTISQVGRNGLDITEFEDGQRISVTSYVDGVIVKTTHWNVQGRKEETLFSKGKEYAVVTYAEDGKSVGGVRYL